MSKEPLTHSETYLKKTNRIILTVGIASLLLFIFGLALLLLSNDNICTRAGLHCAPSVHKKLGTLKTGAVRASVSYFNSLSDIDALYKSVREISKCY